MGMSARLDIEGLRLDVPNQAQLEQKLHESYATIAQLQEKIKECNAISDQQRKHFRLSIENLQTKLNETIIGRDSVLDLRRKECIGQERMINQLQSTLGNLDLANKEQEEALIDMNSRMEIMQQNMLASNSALSQIRGLLVADEEKKGRSVSMTTDNIVEQSPAVLVHLLQRCLQEYENELKVAQFKLQQSEADLEESRSTSDRRLKSMAEDNHKKIQQITEEHDKQIAALNERSNNARKQASSLQSQLTLLQEQTDKQLELKHKNIKELEGKLNASRQHNDELKRSADEKCNSLQFTIGDSKSQYSALRNERDRLLNSVTELQSECQDSKQKLTKCQAELDAEREQNKKLWSREEESNKKYSVLQRERDEQITEIKRLQGLMETLSKDSATQIQENISRIEKEERSKTATKIDDLTTQLKSLNDKYDKTALEFELCKTELLNMQKQKIDLSEVHEQTKHQLHSVINEKSNLASVVEGKSKDIERLKEEKDHYFKLFEERNIELCDIRTGKEKLQFQLEELEKKLTALREQNANMSQMIEMSNKTSQDCKVERDRIEAMLSEKQTEMDELKKSKDDTSRKLKIREKRLLGLEEEREKMMHELENKLKELAEVTGQKDEMLSELKQSRYEVAALTKDNDHLKDSLDQVHSSSEKERKMMVNRLHSLEHELNLTRSAFNARDAVDDKAVKVAETMQKQVTAKRGQIDSLQTKLRWMEECLETTLKEKSCYKDERDKLTCKLWKMTSQNEKLIEEVQCFVDQNKEQKRLVNKLDAALEKAAVKHAAAQALVEQQEQDIARLRLNHQLELKEVKHTAVTKTKTVPKTKRSPNISTNVSIETSTQMNGKPNNSTQPISGVSSLFSSSIMPMIQDRTTKTTQTSVVGGEEPNRHNEDHIHNLAVFSDVGQDLKQLLNDMRTLILQGQVTTTPQQTHSPPTKLASHPEVTTNSVKSQVTEGDSYTDIAADQSTSFSPSETTTSYYSGTTAYTGMSVPSTLTGTTYSQPAHTLSSNYTTFTTGYDSPPFAPPPPPPVLKTRAPQHRQQPTVSFSSATYNSPTNTSMRPTSPVSDLLTSFEDHPRHRPVDMTTETSNSEITETESLVSSDPSTVTLSDHVTKKKGTKKKKKGSSETPKDENADCIKRLELKMKDLSRMGGQLQKENKAMEMMIKSQDNKLKKCRKTEQSVHQLINNKR
uniref:Coiled-coil domain-containing protein 158-like n=1 Tax=Saccoglossus kowalevskii TaxID=10224 RepID=A0ABM0MN14_SACKO|nr:PREDICTED: coiled-coil domain-containing protein 158-like [Saccoglossus kowalevskii]